jgi:hypothetical protein
MMASFILAFSLLTLLMFFVSYCRSLTASSLHKSLTEEVLDVTGIKNHKASGRDFARVMQILQLCPDRPEDRSGLQIVGTYYSFLNLLEQGLAKLSPAVGTWAEEERAGCAHFAAVALGRRIALNREMLAQQVEL